MATDPAIFGPGEGDIVTEAEWLVCTEPVPMLEFLRGNVSDRKLTLLAAACERRHHTFSWEESKAAVEVAERYADGLATRTELRVAYYRTYGGRTRAIVRSGLAHAQHIMRYTLDKSQEWPEQAKLLRDVIGNPSRPVPADPRWLTSTVTALAQAIYAERAFDRLPILADALEEAGCDNADVLSHLRGDGPHVRGCWAVDLVLGKQ